MDAKMACFFFLKLIFFLQLNRSLIWIFFSSFYLWKRQEINFCYKNFIVENTTVQLLFQISYGITEKLRILAVCDSESMLKSNCLHFFTHTKQMFGSLRIQGSKTCCLRLHLLSFSLTSHSFRFLLILPLFLVSNYIASSFQVFEYLPHSTTVY